MMLQLQNKIAAVEVVNNAVIGFISVIEVVNVAAGAVGNVAEAAPVYVAAAAFVNVAAITVVNIAAFELMLPMLLQLH